VIPPADRPATGFAISLEDGRLVVWGSNGTETTAFTRDGIANLRQLVIEYSKLIAGKE
jgi:hypothetical protein